MASLRTFSVKKVFRRGVFRPYTTWTAATFSGCRAHPSSFHGGCLRVPRVCSATMRSAYTSCAAATLLTRHWTRKAGKHATSHPPKSTCLQLPSTRTRPPSPVCVQPSSIREVYAIRLFKCYVLSNRLPDSQWQEARKPATNRRELDPEPAQLFFKLLLFLAPQEGNHLYSRRRRVFTCPSNRRHVQRSTHQRRRLR